MDNADIPSEGQEASALSENTVLSKQGGSCYNFGFAFHNMTFSDCTLKLLVFPVLEEKLDTGSRGKYSRDREVTRDKEDSDTQFSDKDFSKISGSQSESTTLQQFSSLSIRGVQACSNENPSAKYDVKEIPVSSIVLAAKSTFFLKMFTSGLSESLNKEKVSVQINSAEEPVFMGLLNYIYTGEIIWEFSSVFNGTLQLLQMADRFGVEDCVSACIECLKSHFDGIDVKNALLFLSVPQSILENETLSGLLQKSKAVVVAHFSPLIQKPRCQEFLNISLTGLQVVLQADDLAVEKEETVFLAFMEWIHHNCKFKEAGRAQIIRALAPYIRFPYMAAAFIKQTVFQVGEMRKEPMQSILMDSLLFMASREEEHTNRSDTKIFKELPTFCQPRLNYRLPVKSIYFDIPLASCKEWSPDDVIQASSQAFCAQGRWFTVNAKLEAQGEGGCTFGLFLRLDLRLTFPLGEGVSDVSCLYQLCARLSSVHAPYQAVKSRACCTFKEPYHGWGSRDLFRKPWKEVVDNHEVYFPGGAMQLRADVWIMSS